MLTWILNLVLDSIPPDFWAIGAGTGLGIYFFSGILTHVPGIRPYAIFVKPLAGIVTLVCTFMYGGAGVQAMWEEKIKSAKKDVEIAEHRADQLNKDLDKERKKKEKVRVEYREKIRTEIREVAKIIDSKCVVDPIAIEKLNKAASNPEGGNK